MTEPPRPESCAEVPRGQEWTMARLSGLAFAVLYGLIFDTWYRLRIFRQELEDEFD